MKRAIEWVKSIGWITSLGVILTAVLFALAGLKSRREGARVTKGEEHIEKLSFDKTMAGVKRAEKIQARVNKSKQKVLDADIAMERELKKLGDNNASLAAIADRFNSKRVRRKA